MKLIRIIFLNLVLLGAVLVWPNQAAYAQTSNQSSAQSYTDALLNLLRSQIDQAQSALNNVSTNPSWAPPIVVNNGSVSGSTVCTTTPTTSTTGTPSNSPTISSPTPPNSNYTCNNSSGYYLTIGVTSYTCSGLKYILDKTESVLGNLSSGGNTLDLNAWVIGWAGGTNPQDIVNQPEVRAMMEFVQQKRVWFPQVYGNTQVLPEGSSGPSGSASRFPIAVYNKTTKQYYWLSGFSPAELHAAGFLSPQWNLSSLFIENKNNPPSQINPSSQVAVILGLGEDVPTSGTSRVSGIGISYRFNGTVWVKTSNTTTQCLPATNGSGSTGSNSATGTIGSTNNTSGFPKTVTIINNSVNVRMSADTSSAITGTMTKGQTFVATAIVNGESIHGENRWWLRQNGGYIWSGNTDGGTSATSNTIPTTQTPTTPLNPSSSPSVAGPVAPTGSCTDSATICLGVNAAIALVKKIPGYGAAGFTGSLTSYITSGFGDTVANHPLVQAEIRFSEQKMAWFPQVYGTASVLPEGSSAPLGSGGRPPIALYNIERREFYWMPGFSPAELSATGRLSSQWSLYSLFNDLKNNPPSSVNPSSQAAIVMGLGESVPTANTTRTSSFGSTYRFNGTVWVKQ